MLKNIFTSLASIVGSKKPPQLTKEDINELRELTTSAGWKRYGVVIDRYINYNAETLLSASPEVEVDFLRGKIAGMREAYTIVHQLIQENQLDEQRRRDEAERAERRRRQALYATPAWNGRDGV
jgi:hypothetical protein